MKRKKNLYKTLLVNVLVVSLIQTQTMSLAFAETSTASDVGTAINILGNVGQSILQQKQQVVSQQMALQQAQAIQSQLQPKLSASKYFPECQLPQAMAALPQNVCQPTNNAQQLSSIYAYETAASKMVNYFDQMLNEVSTASAGMSCLNKAQKNIDSQLTEMINNLTRLQTKLKEESQTFREANKPLISQLEETNTELMGTSDKGSASNSVAGKTRDFTKLVSQDCQKVIGNGFANTAEGYGFNGLLKATASKNQAANSYQNSKGQIESEIRSQVQKLKDSIASNGIDYWTTQDQSGYGRGQIDLADKLSSYPSLATIMQRERANLLSSTNRIAKDLKKYNYDLPAADKDLSSSLSDTIGSVQSDLKKKYVNSCVVSSSKGVAIDFDKVLNSIEQTSTNNSPLAVNSYKTALQNIMESDDDLETKLSKIKTLENGYKDITVSYTNFSGSKTTETPYNLLSKTMSNCQNKYDSDETSNTKKVQSLLQEYKNLTDNFSANMGNKIVDTMINCNGESLKATDSCTEDTLSPSKQQNFCMAKASTCANKMNACYSEINTAVETRKTKMNTIAKQFNTNVQNMVTRANALYKSQEANVEKLTKMLQQKFPGSNFEIPKDMFITLPETSKDKYGVEVAMNGDINKIIDELPNKMELLKQMFGNQKEAADKEMSEYISKQQQNIQNEKARFTKLQSECSRAAQSSADAIAKANEAGQKAQAESDSKLKSFCRKYDNLRNSPVPSCDTANKLVEDIDGVANRISSQTSQIAQSYANTCAQFNNETSDVVNNCMDEEYIKTATSTQKAVCKKELAKYASSGESQKSGRQNKQDKDIKLSTLCKSKDTTDEDFIKAAISKMSSDDKENLPKGNGKLVSNKKILEALKSGNFENFGDDNTFFENLYNEYGDTVSKGDICKNLTEKANSLSDSNGKKAKDDAKSAQDKLVENAKASADYKAQSAIATDDKKTEAERKAATDKMAALEKAVTDGKDFKDLQAKIDGGDKKGQASSSEIDKKITEFINHTSPESDSSSTDDPKTAAFKRLGEQATGSCDAESTASNSTGKNPLFFDLNSYDKQKLGGVSQ